LATNIEQLKTLIKERALQTGKLVKLASGAESSYYINCKNISLHGPSLNVLSKAIADFFDDRGWPSWVAGVSVGGDPIVAGIIFEASLRGRELDALLVRKAPKAHGGSQGKAVEGLFSEGLGSGFLVEDVVSTGGSSLVAARHMIAEGYKLEGMLCLVDREMGGVQSLQTELKIPIQSLFKVSQIIEN